MDKPLLLLDVDGPLNPYAAKPTKRPEGYETFRYRPLDAKPWEKPLRVWLNKSHGPMLLNLKSHFDLVWTTTWNEEANSFIAPKVGLPELPVMNLVRNPNYHKNPLYSFGTKDKLYKVFWKTPQVLEYVGERAFLWFDDELEKGDQLWLDERTLAPFKLVKISPRVGLLEEDFKNALEWAESL